MIELKFDTEGITDCPMNELVTRDECLDCQYFGGFSPHWQALCNYGDNFPEPKEAE